MSESYGEYLVGISFNPSADPRVDEIKRKTAELIDLCHDDRDNPTKPEAGRCWALAITHYETAAMWAVKAATKKPRT